MGATNRPQELDEAVLRYIKILKCTIILELLLFFFFVQMSPTFAVYLTGALQRGFMWHYQMQTYVMWSACWVLFLALKCWWIFLDFTVSTFCNFCSSRRDSHCWKIFWESMGIHWAKMSWPVLQGEFQNSTPHVHCCFLVDLYLFVDVSFDRMTEGYSGSDLTSLAKDAALGPIRGKFPLSHYHIARV